MHQRYKKILQSVVFTNGFISS